MRGIELERKLVGAVLDSYQRAQLTEIEPKWFSDEQLAEVLDTLDRMNGDFSDLSEVENALKERYPENVLTEKNLRELQFSAMYIDDFETAVRSLKERYYLNRLSRANLVYAESPTAENRLKLEDCLREVDEMDTPEDDGSLDELVNVFEDERQGLGLPSVKAYPSIDHLLGGGIEAGTLMTIGARPGVGKTAFGINLAVEMLRRNDNMQIDFFTLEMTKNQMTKRFIANLSRINSYKLRNLENLTEHEWQTLNDRMTWLRGSGLRVHTAQQTLDQIVRTIRRRVHAADGKPYVAMIDYLGLVSVQNQFIKRHEQVGQITRALKLLTNELGISVVLFSQLNRATVQQTDAKPTLANLRDSGDVEQDSSIVGFLYPTYPEDPQSEKICLDIQKNREGMVGILPFRFVKKEMRFEEVHRDRR